MRTILAFMFFLAFLPGAVAQSPWAPEADQKWLRERMPKGVPLSERARVFKLRQVFQSLYFLNGHEQRDIAPVTNQIDPWRVSGGMHWEPQENWKNVTLLDVPEGKKILLWQEYVEAGAPGPVAKIRWWFPQGTIAYDVLVRTNNGAPRVFEVRTQEKGEKVWETGVTYRPAVDLPIDEPERHAWRFSVNLIPASQPFDGQGTWRTVKNIDPDTPFAPRTTLAHDNGFLIPKTYVGAGMSCNTCHRHAGQRTGYGQALRGDDGRFSWHPFDEKGGIDWRWPLELVKQ